MLMMLTRREIMLGAACAVFATPAPAADATAVAFVTAIYNAYKGRNTNGVRLDTDRDIRRYFEPSLAELIIKDRKNAARRNEVPTLDGDPFVDAQDWDIKTFNIEVSDTAPAKASATVKFVNEDEPKTVVLDLVKIANAWKISDITWQHDGKPETLRGLFAH